LAADQWELGGLTVGLLLHNKRNEPIVVKRRAVVDPRTYEPNMPQFLIERNFAERLEVTREIAANVKRVNDELSVRWVFSFLSADKKKTYCLYEAPNAEAIREAAQRLNIPADKIVELGGELRPEVFA
jgi:hypothetical protein